MDIILMWKKLCCWYQRIPLMLVSGYLDEMSSHVVDGQIFLRQGLDNEVVTLTQPFEAYGLISPAGFTYNGASSPRFAWFVIPRMYKMLKASARHDYACLLAKNFKERMVADVVFFLMAYYVEHLSLWRCILGLVGVRIGAYLGIGRSY